MTASLESSSLLRSLGKFRKTNEIILLDRFEIHLQSHAKADLCFL